MTIQATHGLLCLVLKRSFAKALAPYARNMAGHRFYQSVSAKAMQSATSPAHGNRGPSPQRQFSWLPDSTWMIDFPRLGAPDRSRAAIGVYALHGEDVRRAGFRYSFGRHSLDYRRPRTSP